MLCPALVAQSTGCVLAALEPEECCVETESVFAGAACPCLPPGGL